MAVETLRRTRAMPLLFALTHRGYIKTFSVFSVSHGSTGPTAYVIVKSASLQCKRGGHRSFSIMLNASGTTHRIDDVCICFLLFLLPQLTFSPFHLLPTQHSLLP